MSDEPLRVVFLDEVHLVPGDRALTFGRRADLVIDENPFLHRVVGRFVCRQGVWWIQNHARHAYLQVEWSDGTRVELAPGGQMCITSPGMRLRFRAGPANYELECGVDLDLTDRDLLVGDGSVTRVWADVPLSASQHLLLVALCAPRLRGGASHPSNAAAAASLGWTLRKYHRQLDDLCHKLGLAGVAGLVGYGGERAVGRRGVLVAHALSAGLVSVGDLGLLAAQAAPVPVGV